MRSLLIVCGGGSRSSIEIIRMELSLVLFLLGTLGFIFNRNNLILMIVSIEIILLAVSVMLLLFSWQFNDILAEIFGLYIITVAGTESAIGLAIVVAYFKIRKG